MTPCVVPRVETLNFFAFEFFHDDVEKLASYQQGQYRALRVSLPP